MGRAWDGSSSACYEDRIVDLLELISQVVAAGQGVDAIVRTQAGQVEHGRETLGNVLNGLQLAIPVAASLYFSGPAGPALLQNFQLVMAHAGVGTGAGTAKTMDDNARQHAQLLAALTEHCDRLGINLLTSLSVAP